MAKRTGDSAVGVNPFSSWLKGLPRLDRSADPALMLRFGSRVMVAALVALTSVGASSAVPVTARPIPTACISDNGTDVERYFGIEGHDVVWPNIQGLRPPCLTVTKGNIFHRAHGWITQLQSRAVYPAGYEPAHRAPMADFLSKLTQSRYVISREGRVEITRSVRGPALFRRAKLGQFGDLFVAPDTTLVPGSTIEARSAEWTTLEPFDAGALPAGDHTIEIYWTLSGVHCDGFTPDPALSCLPAGESLTTTTTFTVIGRH